ncbi:hypothetical protein RMSM_07544 [Rhodopirellula maiorica SM1]|uniref:Uncharacterized protein n=1 Tax=Rhodopirellula maiorica SM1 TaxID=1265738 RepID=M5R8Z8_9BACT|nr:hypothetical protein RMSM_07544 [Rhodopirellula maiorica SM1]
MLEKSVESIERGVEGDGPTGGIVVANSSPANVPFDRGGEETL